MTHPDGQSADPATLGRLAGSLAALSLQVADLRRQLDTATRRLDQAGVDQLAVQFADLSGRFEVLATTVAEALDAASPTGPAAPRWDNPDSDTAACELARLRTWVEKVLVPGYCVGGAYTLAECWPQHPEALWELGALCAQWRRIYDRARPNPALALEFSDRWLPGVMRHIGEATRTCMPRHRADAGLHHLHRRPKPSTQARNVAVARTDPAPSWPRTAMAAS